MAVWFLRFVSNQTLATRKLYVEWNRSGPLITHDVPDPFTMVSTCRFATFHDDVDLSCSQPQQGRWLKSHSNAGLNANPERPPAFWQPAPLMHSYISLRATCFVPKSAGFSHPGTLAMVSSRRATASCTHKTWVWKCLTLPTPRREAVAFDAVASTRTRGLTTLATSAAIATAPRALGAASPKLVATAF